MAGLRATDEELKEILVTRLEVMGEAEFDKAQFMAKRLKIPIERALVQRGRVPLGFLLEQLAQVWGVGFIDLKVSDIQPDALRVLTEQYAKTNSLVPFEVRDRQLMVAMWDPRNKQTLAEIERLTGLHPLPHLAPEAAIRRAHLLYKGDLHEMMQRSAADEVWTLTQRRPGEEDRSAVELMNRILEYASVVRASDIHIEPYELEAVVRYRIDGVLREVLSLPSAAMPSLLGRIKALSGMRIDDRRSTRDGRFEIDLGGFKVDLRVSSVPTLWGEKIALRVLAREEPPLDLEDLGLAAADYQTVIRNILRPFGMILISGPTGSGKTTSLYAVLLRLAAERQTLLNIATIEDPIECAIPRVIQIPVDPGGGLPFAAGLQALLRQDPDVIMVGEIRDRETAEIAVRAALAGRLLLSTLHANEATVAVPRLVDMGVEPFMLASTLALVLSQRLVRRICVSCRESVAPDPGTVKALRARPDFDDTVRVLQADGVIGKADDPFSGVRWFRGKGCRRCGGSGFRRRLGVFELLEIDDQIRTLIIERRSASAIRAHAIGQGMKTMFQDGLAKVFLGETTAEEVFRVAL